MRVLPLITALLLLTATPLMAADQAARELDWLELMPKDEVDSLMDTPAVTHEGSFKQVQTGSFRAIKELNGLKVKIAGYIVPVEVDGDSQMSEFFIVPYFGACIHVPPPPPNQIVYVKMDKGIALDSIYEAYWVTGRMQVSRKSTQLGAAAYSLTATKIEIYKY